MNLRDTILSVRSKADCQHVVDWIGDSPARFRQVLLFMTGPDALLAQRASWPLSWAVLSHPGLARPHIGALLQLLQRPGLHNALWRNALRIFQQTEIPARWQGQVMTVCFDALLRPAEKPAVKAFAMGTLENLARKHPDILPELQLIIGERWDTETPAFRARGRHLLKSLSPITAGHCAPPARKKSLRN